MKQFKYSLLIIAAAIVFVSCKKDGFGPLTDARPVIPVTVANSVEFRPGPTVNASRAANTFSIILEIPVNSGRKIKEITKIVASPGSSAALFGTTGLYNAAVIAGTNSNQITFTTSLTEYDNKPGSLFTIPANNPPVNAVELTQQFYFLITLDNDETIITQQVRVLVIP